MAITKTKSADRGAIRRTLDPAALGDRRRRTLGEWPEDGICVDEATQIEFVGSEPFGHRRACDLANPDVVHDAERLGSRRDGPTLIDVPIGPLPSPWDFIQMPRVRGL